jgi:hypothetical protein
MAEGARMSGSAHQRAMEKAKRKKLSEEVASSVREEISSAVERISASGQSKSPKKRTLVHWLRGVGVASILFGLAGFLFAMFYWPAVWIFYGGLLLLIIDCLFLEGLRRSSKVSVAFSILVIGVLIAWKVVFVPAPLWITPSVYDGEYAKGTKIGDIEWRSSYTDVRVAIENPTARDYTDIDLYVLIPNVVIVDVSQVTKLPGVTIMGSGGGDLRATFGYKDGARTTTIVPHGMPSENFSTRIRCDKIPNNSHIELVFAVASESTGGWGFTLGFDEKTGATVLPPFAVAVSKRIVPEWVGVTAFYHAWRRPYSESLRVTPQKM